MIRIVLKVSHKKSVSTKSALQNEGKMKTVPYKQKMREFDTTGPVLQEMLEGVIGNEGGRW